MNFILLSNKPTDIEEFIDFWSQFYIDPNENKYYKNINSFDLDNNKLVSLFEWKNGSRLSSRKYKSLENKILSKLEIINYLKKSSNFELREFLDNFKDISAIWKIFLLHIIKPDEYPIFDQHVYRAFYYIKYSKLAELSNKNNEKEKIYFEEYLLFIKEIKGNFSLKKIDEALWSFGKFLKSDYKKIIIN